MQGVGQIAPTRLQKVLIYVCWILNNCSRLGRVRPHDGCAQLALVTMGGSKSPFQRTFRHLEAPRECVSFLERRHSWRLFQGSNRSRVVPVEPIHRRRSDRVSKCGAFVGPSRARVGARKLRRSGAEWCSVHFGNTSPHVRRKRVLRVPVLRFVGDRRGVGQNRLLDEALGLKRDPQVVDRVRVTCVSSVCVSI